jgi:hypothetical protein
MPNILIDKLPNEIDGIPINTDFRVGILFEIMMQDSSITESQKINLALNLFYSHEISDYEKAIENIIWFYSCGKKSTASKSNKIIYSFEHDAEYIFSAFLSEYNINLNRIKFLHWWEFKALFLSLSENNLFNKIMGYRAINLSEIKDKEMKKYYRNLQVKYRLPDNRTQEEKEKDFASALG